MAGRFKLTTHKEKECVKVHFEIHIKTAENVPVSGPVYVEWKRGSKNENKGESKHVNVKDKKAVFEELLEITSTLYKIPKKGYESKNISITLKEEKGKKGNSIAKTVIDLAEFAGKDEKRSFSLKSKKSKVAPTLTLHFKSKEREMSPDEDVTETDNATEENLSDEDDDAEDFTDDKDDSSIKSGKSSSSLGTPGKVASAHDKRDSRDMRRDSVSSIGSLDVEQLRAELDKAKKRTKELATENVDYEDKVKELTKELEDAKKSQSSPGPGQDAELRRKIKDLTQENTDKDAQIKKLQEESKQTNSNAGAMSPEKEAQMKGRLKELATENVDLEEQVNALKKELDTVKAQGGKKSEKDDGSQKQVQDELRKKIKELTRANEDTEEEVEALKKQVEQLKKSPSLSVSANVQSGEDTKKLQNELRDKEDRIQDLEIELDRLKRKAPAESTNVQEYKDKIDNYKEKLRAQEEESDKKLDSARAVESELRDRIRELEDSNDTKLKSSSSSNRDRQDKEKLERDIEKEKDLRKKAEKEARELRDKLEDLEESSSRGSGKYKANGKDDDDKVNSLEKELRLQKLITTAVFSHTGHYSSEEGVSETALAVWAVLSDERAFDDSADAHAVGDRVISSIHSASNCAPNDMNMLFYWLSTTSALLHMLRDEPDIHSTNDRDPIIDGIHKPKKEPSSSSTDLQERLEWRCFEVYKKLVSVICSKLTPVLAPIIIEKPLTDKHAQVKNSAVMRILDRVLARTRHHYLYDAVVQQLFVQIFYFVSCHLVNTILQKNKLTPSIGFQIKLGLSHLEDWISQPSGSSAERALLAPCSAQLEGLRDVGGVLVLDKALLSDSSTVQSIFKVLNLRQMKRLLEVFEPDALASGGLTTSVRDAVATTWNDPSAASLPLLFDPSKIIDFSPTFD